MYQQPKTRPEQPLLVALSSLTEQSLLVSHLERFYARFNPAKSGQVKKPPAPHSHPTESGLSAEILCLSLEQMPAVLHARTYHVRMPLPVPFSFVCVLRCVERHCTGGSDVRALKEVRSSPPCESMLNETKTHSRSFLSHLMRQASEGA